MRTIEVTCDLDVVLPDGSDVTLTIEGTYTPGSPGRTYGPPENCYPPDPAEIEITRIVLAGEEWGGTLTDAEESRALDALQTTAEEECEEDCPPSRDPISDRDPPPYRGDEEW